MGWAISQIFILSKSLLGTTSERKTPLYHQEHSPLSGLGSRLVADRHVCRTVNKNT